MKIPYITTLFIVLAIFGLTKTQKTFPTSQEDQVHHSLQDTSLQKSMERGAIIYHDFCLQCHMAEGQGVPETFPPLAKADYLKDTAKSILAVKKGLSGKITVNGKIYNSAMPDPGLYPDEVADVMNYIRNTWGNDYKTRITEAQVEDTTK